MEGDRKEGRAGILAAVSKPIHLAVLVVLIVEGLLAFLLSKAAPKDLTLYVSLMVGVMVLTITAFFILHYQELRLQQRQVIPATGEAESAKKSFKWDVFLAAPMAALTFDEFKVDNLRVMEIKRVLEEECNFQSVFYAGANMLTQEDFESADVSIDTDINAIKDSKYFVLIYPDKIVSSVLFEAGIALALGKPSFYFGNPKAFPFLMQEANNKFNFVKIHSADSLDEIIHCIKKNRNKLFNL